jgi:hypothetical protein
VSTEDEPSLDIAELYPADPELMVSPEGDSKGLAELKKNARGRREERQSR